MLTHLLDICAEQAERAQTQFCTNKKNMTEIEKLQVLFRNTNQYAFEKTRKIGALSVPSSQTVARLTVLKLFRQQLGRLVCKEKNPKIQKHELNYRSENSIVTCPMFR